MIIWRLTRVGKNETKKEGNLKEISTIAVGERKSCQPCFEMEAGRQAKLFYYEIGFENTKY
jgi:hypothetical protein